MDNNFKGLKSICINANASNNYTQQTRRRYEMIFAVTLIQMEAFHGRINLYHK